MPRLALFKTVWLSILIVIIYIGIYINFGFLISKFLADWLALIGLSFMTASMAPVAYRAFVNGISTDRDKFIFSYWLIWTVVWWQRVWIILMAVFDGPTEWRESAIPGFLALSIALAAGYGIAAPLTGEAPLHKTEIVIFSLAAGFAGIIAGIAIGVFFVTGLTN